MVFSGISPLVIGDVADGGDRITVRARAPRGTARAHLRRTAEPGRAGQA
ncbi:hypothetical protein [Streptomyces sp. NPDC019890]